MKNIIKEEIKKDISLSKYELDTTLPLLNELRQKYFRTNTEVCIERAKYITEYLKNPDDENETSQISRAKAIKNYMSKREIIFHDNNLIAGSSTSKALGAAVYPEYLGLTIWAELETISSREINPQKLSKEDADTLNFDIYPYWIDRSIMERTRQEENPDSLWLMEKLAYFTCAKASVISHTTPYFEQVLEKGLGFMIEEVDNKIEQLKSKNQDSEITDKINFFLSMKISMEGIIAYAENISEKAKQLAEKETDANQKKYYNDMAKVCSVIPAKPATTYREAASSLWICMVGILAENVNMAMGPGRLDQILYPYYKKDLDSNNLTVEEAINITGSLWLKIADNTNLVPAAAEKLFGGAGSVPAVTLGGVDVEGNDAVNDLTYIMLKVTELLSLKDPNVNARFNYEVNSQEYRDRVGEVIISTKAIPAMYNDVTNIATLENQGVETKDARDYAVIGCVELGSAGREYNSSSSILFNLNAALEMALNSGKRPHFEGDKQIGPVTKSPDEFANYQEFWDAFIIQLSRLLQQAIDLNEAFGRMYQKYLPSPLLSSFFKGPFEKEKDLIFGGAKYNSSGVAYIAFADTVDSLNAIEDLVYDQKKYSLSQINDALEKNFEGEYEQLHHYLKTKAPKYGKEHDGEERKNGIAQRNAKNLIKFLYQFLQEHTNYRGGKYRPEFWTMTNHAGQGKITGALPNGRKSGEVFSSGITPSSQVVPDLLPALTAVAELGNCEETGKSKYIPGGVALNMKYTPRQNNQSEEDYLKIFGDTNEGYFRQGGMQVQFNIQTYETLIDAKKNPDKYPELIVRVSGYSAFFKDLNDAMKDELITRTQYDLNTRCAVILENFKQD